MNDALLKRRRQLLITCSLLYGAVAGLMINTNGQYYGSLAESLGVPVGRITISSALMGIVSLLCTPLIVKNYEKKNAKTVAAFALLIYCVSYSATGLCQSLPVYYLLSMLRGTMQGFLVFYLVSALIKAWYVEGAGRALSITAFSSGIAGILANLLMGYVIESAGWRTAMVGTGIVSLVVALPGILLTLVRSPEEYSGYGPENAEQMNGQCPAGTDRGSEDDSEYALPQDRRKYFLLGLLIIVVWGLPYCFTQHFKVFATASGFSALTGAAMLSISMAGNITSKFLLGVFSDKVGRKASAEIVCGVVLLGLLVLLLPLSRASLYFAAFLMGSSASFMPIIIPQTVSIVFSGKEFKRVYARYSTILSMTSAAWITLIGLLYSLTRDYRPLFAGGIVLMAGSIWILQRFVSGKQENEHE